MYCHMFVCAGEWGSCSHLSLPLVQNLEIQIIFFFEEGVRWIRPQPLDLQPPRSRTNSVNGEAARKPFVKNIESIG